MKQSFFYILLLLVIAVFGSCTNTNNYGGGVGQGGTLEFNATVENTPFVAEPAAAAAATKVVENDIMAKGFTITGFYYEGTLFSDIATTIAPAVFDPRYPEIKYVDGKFQALTRPWRVKNNTRLSFFAWSDNNVESGCGVLARSADADTGFPWIDFAQHADPTKQSDLVAVKVLDQRNDVVISTIDLPFRHALSKVSFRAYSSMNINVSFSSITITYAPDKVMSKGRFTYNGATDAVGEFSGLTTPVTGSYNIVSGTLPPVTDVNNSIATSVSLGEVVLLPQTLEAGYATVKVTYRIEIAPGTWSAAISKTVPLSAQTLASGSHYCYALDITASDIRFALDGVAEWNGTSDYEGLPIIAGPGGDVLLLYDAIDAPYEANGKRYWLDRSGYNRHAEIVGNITYEAVAKRLVFNDGNTLDNYISIPDIGYVSEASAECLIVNNGFVSLNDYLIRFQNNGSNSFTVWCVSYNREVKFITAAGKHEMTIGRIGSSDKEIRQYRLHTYRKGKISQSMTFNDNVQSVVTHTSSFDIGECNNNSLGRGLSGQIGYFKLTGRVISTEEVINNLAKLKTNHSGIIEDAKPGPDPDLPTNQNGLIAFFKPEAPRPDHNYYWRDLTANGNHLSIIGSGIRYDDKKLSYVFDGAVGSYMKFAKPLVIGDKYTVIFHLRNEDVAGAPRTERVLVNFTNDPSTLNSNGALWYMNNRNNNLPLYINNNEGMFLDGPSTSNYWGWGILRNGGQSGIYRNDPLAWRFYDCGTTVIPMTDFYIGNNSLGTMPFKGRIKAIYVYNRAITDPAELNAITQEAGTRYGTNF